MTVLKVDFFMELWQKEGPFANPVERDGPKVYHIMAHGRKNWPEPVRVCIVFSEGEADLIIAEHELGKRVGMAADIRQKAVDKIAVPN